MATEDEILRAYEEELAARPGGRRNRGFWVILGVLIASAIFLIVEILAHRPLANSIGLAQESLRRSQAAAGSVREDTGGFAAADAATLEEAIPDLTFRDGSEPSTGVRDVSVWASEDVWAAAAQARPDACFYVRLEVGEDPRYGAGTGCTGKGALEADQPRW